MTELQRYRDRLIEIIYSDAAGKFTQRRIVVYAVYSTFVRAYCMDRRAIRTFALDRIFAVQPVPERSDRQGRSAV